MIFRVVQVQVDVLIQSTYTTSYLIAIALDVPIQSTYTTFYSIAIALDVPIQSTYTTSYSIAIALDVPIQSTYTTSYSIAIALGIFAIYEIFAVKVYKILTFYILQLVNVTYKLCQSKAHIVLPFRWQQ